VSRMETNCLHILAGKQDGKRSCGRPKRGGKYRDIPVEMYVEKITFENGLNLFS